MVRTWGRGLPARVRKTSSTPPPRPPPMGPPCPYATRHPPMGPPARPMGRGIYPYRATTRPRHGPADLGKLPDEDLGRLMQDVFWARGRILGLGKALGGKIGDY